VYLNTKKRLEVEGKGVVLGGIMRGIGNSGKEG
jgi:hypothetical protein